MSKKSVPAVRAAVIDLYNNFPNQGMRCIKQLLEDASRSYFGIPLEFQVFDARAKNEIPDLSFDIYISTGGPGSPFDSEGQAWEKDYFRFLDQLWRHNAEGKGLPKYGLFICHSYQMVARHFKFGDVIERKSGSFGMYPVHKTEAGKKDPLFDGLADPFYAADFRDWQVLQPRKELMQEMGAEILCMEKERPHVDLERAMMAIRLMKEMVAVQFHPEADAEGMYAHFSKPEQKEKIIAHHGQEKYNDILSKLSKPQYIKRTYSTVIPGFLKRAIAHTRPEVVQQYTH